eukprot:COSAG02_NODE_16415_length_1085_cov_1.612576_2_plen_219_part_00
MLTRPCTQFCSDCSKWQGGGGTCQCSPNACGTDDGADASLIAFGVVAVLIFVGVAVCAFMRRQQWINARKSAANALLAQTGQSAGHASHPHMGYHQQVYTQAPQPAIPVAVAVGVAPNQAQAQAPVQYAAPPSQLDASTPVNPPPTGALHRSSSKRFDCVFSNKTNCDALCLDVRTRLEAWHPPISVWQQKTNIPKGDAKHLIHRTDQSADTQPAALH